MNRYYILTGAAVIVVMIWIIDYYLRNRRNHAVKKLAESLNLTYSAKGNETLSASVSLFNLFLKGHSKQFTNVMTGTRNNIPVTIFDYCYTTGGGRSSHTYRQSVVYFESDKLNLPDFVLRPENLLDKVGKVFGNKDINFESYPVFSKKYLLRSDQEESVRNIFTDSILIFYEQHQHLSTEAAGKRIIIYQLSKRIPPDRMEPFIQDGYALFELFKK